jgi:hypothetical protein
MTSFDVNEQVHHIIALALQTGKQLQIQPNNSLWKLNPTIFNYALDKELKRVELTIRSNAS